MKFNMKSIAELGKMGLAVMNRNLPSILSGAAIAGIAATVWATYKAAPEINSALDCAKSDKADKVNEDCQDSDDISVDDVDLTAWETFKAVAPYVWKPAVCVAFSTTCVIAANVMNVQRLTMLAGAYKLSEKKLREYEEKAKTLLGEKKATELHDTVVKEMAPDIPKNDDLIERTGKGKQLCYDPFYGMFYSSVEAIRTAESALNKALVNGDSVTLNDLWYELGLTGKRKHGDMLGWQLYHGYGNTCVDIDLTFDAREIDGEQKVVCILDYHPMLDDRNFSGRL